ncbi:MAG: DUF2442 domain-containing protein [Bacteroidota bacterium]|jgi:hypothetical protein|nr:DUF2442 domain-containing protein [Ignavibacteria bacterium]MCU7497804.1 DUF2442 domain-containing protein [Ignavibacteria bacterium]MCU7511085.1 DUF2442 domain-containing protein [Ignavibacteria bacterium]MCU7518632.1 DUF2442 domain-containing protein [Ignavibacteria bacterium]MCU7522965.1 DUF2442 domain-containing protein [Ignavibacteria bacterium]
MFLHIEHFEFKGGYSLKVRFNNGIEKDVDLSNELYGEVFEPLKDESYFRKAFLNRDTNTIEWPNGADFAPEFLFEIGKEVRRSA